MSECESVKVCTRVRPLVPLEKQDKSVKFALKYPQPNTITVDSRNNETKTFTYDYVCDERTSQQTVYNECVLPLVNSCMKGYNATILAYGQTGSGKTHTMGTSSISGLAESEFGIVPRVIDDMFTRIKQASDAKEATYMVYCQFLEIYQEDIIDLLVPASERTTTDLPYIQEKKLKSGIVEIDVVNCKRIEVRSYDEMMDLLERGTRERSVGATNMNAGSSRSHAIFTVYLKFKENKPVAETDTENDTEVIDESSQQSMYAMDAEHGMITAKFNFVDLAGSERLKKTGAQGERMQEGININKGLLALGNVISALEKQAQNKHVPFRDSKITRLLQDSLGGNAKTLMIACVSPANTNLEETISTLQYANRARNIQNKPIKNVDPLSQQINTYKQRILELEQLLAMNGGVAQAVPKGWKLVQEEDYNKLIHDSAYHETEYELSTQRVKELRMQLSSKQDEYVELNNKYDSIAIYNDKLKQLLRQHKIDLPTDTANTDDVSILQAKNDLLLKQQQKIIQLKNQVKCSIQIIENLKRHSTIEMTPETPGTDKKRKRTKGEIGLSIDLDDTDGVESENTSNVEPDIDVNTIVVSDCDDDAHDELLTMQSKLALSEREAQEQCKRQAELQIALGSELNKQQQQLTEQQQQYAEYQRLLSETNEFEQTQQAAIHARNERDNVDNEIKSLQINDREYDKKQKMLKDKLENANNKIKLLEDKLKEFQNNKKRIAELEPLMQSKQNEIQRLLADIEEKKRQRAEQQKKAEQNERKNRDILNSLKTQIAQLSRLQTTTQYQLKQEQRKRIQIDSMLQRKQAENVRLKEITNVVHRPGTAHARNRLKRNTTKTRLSKSSQRPRTANPSHNDNHVLTDIELQQLYALVQNECIQIQQRKHAIDRITELYNIYNQCKSVQISHEANMLDFYNTCTNIDTDAAARSKYEDLEQDLITLTSHFKIAESNLTDAIQQFNSVNKPKNTPEFRMYDIYESKKTDISIYLRPQLRLNSIHEANYLIRQCADLSKLPEPSKRQKTDKLSITPNKLDTEEYKEYDETTNNNLLSPNYNNTSNHYKIVHALPHTRSTTDIFNRLNDPSNATGVHKVKYEEKQRMKRATPQSTDDYTNNNNTNSMDNTTVIHNGLPKSTSDSSSLNEQSTSKYDTSRPVFDRLRDPSHFPTQAKIKDEAAKQMKRQPSQAVLPPTQLSLTTTAAQLATAYNVPNQTKHKSNGSYGNAAQRGSELLTSPQTTQLNTSASKSRSNSPRKTIDKTSDNNIFLSPQPASDKTNSYISPEQPARVLNTIDNNHTPSSNNLSVTPNTSAVKPSVLDSFFNRLSGKNKK